MEEPQTNAAAKPKEIFRSYKLGEKSKEVCCEDQRD
jgi:hypothetical protein